jgi:hypothetical protein
MHEIEGRLAMPTRGGTDHLPVAVALFGRDVLDSRGHRLGRVELIVRLPDGERQAVVRTGSFLRRRRFFVSLAGASLINGRVIISAPPSPVLHLDSRISEGHPHRAA